ncbi:glycoside hydrolase family 2 protein [Glaciecola sp. 1036]|uniref:glycoside hydrolase family 2 protein n=1 Tax=Alteromonadaceae TaxID=72275 RepID=UPI003D04E32F
MSDFRLCRTSFFLIIFLLSFYSHSSDTSELIQNPHARSLISLNGKWNRIIDPYENGYYNHRYEAHTNGYFKNRKPQTPSELVEYNFETAKKIDVPGDWNSQEEQLFLYEGTLWYHKRFELNKQQNKRYLLHFGAANYHAIVYVNGEKVGEHEGGFTPFQFDITHVAKNRENFVVVKVDNSRKRDQIPTVNTDWWNYGGLTRSVSVIEVPESYLSDYHLALNSTTGAIEGSLKLSNAQKDGKVSLIIPELHIEKTIKVKANGETKFSINAKPELWRPENPKRYKVILSFNGETIEDAIGFRTIEVKGTEILLNGEPVFLRGISIHEESPFGAGRAWTEADGRTLLTWAKELGCNFVRLAHYPHNEMMLKIADEMGFMVWSEIPVYWTVMFEDQAVYAKAQQQLTEMISRDKNRASIVMWSVANETPVSDARISFLSRLIEKARELDSNRLITAAMDTQSNAKNGKLIDDPLAKYVDIIGINSYCGWYSDAPANCANLRWNSHYEKPIIMSEMGAGALAGLHGEKNEIWTEEYQSDVYKHNIEMMKNMPTLRGVTPWILKDFRSPRRPLDDIQDFWNRKGLLSETGQRKQAWYVLRDFYRSIAQQDQR